MTDNLQLGQHISHRFNEELEHVRQNVLEMGGMVERQITDGLQSLVERDSVLGELVSNRDVEVNAMEVQIDEQCTQILARRQPAASDLRLVISIIKTITDLERIGDEAEKLGRYAMQLADKDIPSSQFTGIRHLGQHVQQMLKNALDSFSHMDVDRAYKTIESDLQVNEEFEAISRQLITRMMEDPREIKTALRVSWCARALERIGDHSKNICEYVIFLVKGKDVRHTGLKKSTPVTSSDSD